MSSLFLSFSFQVCYAAEFGQSIATRADGIPMEQLIASVPGVKILVSIYGIRHVQWCENKPPSPICKTRLLLVHFNVYFIYYYFVKIVYFSHVF